MAKKVIVVRVGAKTIRIVHMDNTPVNPTVYGCVRVPTPAGAVVDGEVKNIMDVSRRIKQACQEKGIATRDVIFSLSSSKIANRETTIPFVKDSKIQGIVDAKVGDMFPIDKDRYIFSYVKQGNSRNIEENEEVTDGSENLSEEEQEETAEITDDTAKVDNKKKSGGFNLSLGKKKKETEEIERVIDLLVYAAPIDLVRSYYALAEGCDFNVVGIEVDGNGIFQIMRRQVEEGVKMAVQINRDNTLINIMSKDKLLLQRVIPYGAMNIIEAAMNEPAFRVPEYDKAVTLLATQKVLLHTLNANNPQNDLSMEKRIELTQSASSLIGNLYRVMEYYNSRYREEPIREIIVTGNGAKIAGMHELLTNELGVTAKTPDELSGVSFNRQIEVNANILQYVGCFGAVYSPVNFIPEDIKNKTANRDSLMSIAIVVAAAVLICVIVAVFSIVRVTTARSAYESANNQVIAMKPIEEKNTELNNLKDQIGTYFQIKNKVNTCNNRLQGLLEQIAKRLPSKFKLNSLNTTNEGGVLNCVTTDKLSSVSATILRLNLLEDIQDVAITSTITKDQDGTTKKTQYTYTISFNYVSNYDQLEEVVRDYYGDQLANPEEGQ